MDLNLYIIKSALKLKKNKYLNNYFNLIKNN